MKRSLALSLLLVTLAACTTTPKPAEMDPGAEPPSTVQFVPAAYRADLRHTEGPHAALFDTPSFALWVGRPVMEAKQASALQSGEILEPGLSGDAEKIIEDFILIELHLESAFGDMGTSYDAVAMRSVETHLVLPDGTMIEPVQLVLGKLLEADDGALRRFKRHNLLAFPKRDYLTGQPTIPDSVPGVSLVLSGYDTRFEFEWLNLAAGQDPAPTRTEEAIDYLQVGFQDLFLTVRRLAHVFD